MQPVAAAADVGQQEGDRGMARRQLAELARVGRLLARVVAAAVLPDVVQHWHAALGGQPADRIEQRIVGRGGWRRA